MHLSCFSVSDTLSFYSVFSASHLLQKHVAPSRLRCLDRSFTFAYSPVHTISSQSSIKIRGNSNDLFQFASERLLPHHVFCLFVFSFFIIFLGKAVWITSARWSHCHWTRVRTWLPRRNLWPCTPTTCRDAPSSTPTTRWARQRKWSHCKKIK